MHSTGKKGTDLKSELDIATLGGGCFWCTEAIFSQLKGIEKVESGYSGGNVKNPSYEDVCTGTTGHAESIQITYDPGIITYEQLLNIFFTVHDPTTLNRQGADLGTQYRSVVFYHNIKQKVIAEKVIAKFNKSKIWNNPIVTELVPFSAFYKAEEYHQKYFQKNPNNSYCNVVIAPKVAKFREKYFKLLKS